VTRDFQQSGPPREDVPGLRGFAPRGLPGARCNSSGQARPKPEIRSPNLLKLQNGYLFRVFRGSMLTSQTDKTRSRGVWSFSLFRSFRISDFPFGCLGVTRYSRAMSTVTRLLHTRYRVDDLERTVRFYKEVLGLQEVNRHKSPRGSELVFLKAPGSEELIELCSFPASGPVRVQPDLTHLAFAVDSLDEFGKHLATLGIQYSDGPHRSASGAIAFIDAPEGYEIELIEARH